MALGFNPSSINTQPGRVLRPGSRSGFDFRVELKGLYDLIRKLDRRVLRMQQSILRKALLAFAEPIRADAERRAQSAVSPRIQIKAEVRMRGTGGTVKIGPTGDYFYLFFFEYGYWIRKQRKGPPITWVNPRPTMRPAYDAHKEAGLAAMEKILVDALSEEVADAA